MVMSDTHYFDPSLWSDCADYTTAVNSDRKMFSESRGILKRAIDLVRQNRSDAVLIPGDLTKDGEYACHQGVHELFEQVRDELRAEGADTRFYFINGNGGSGNGVSGNGNGGSGNGNGGQSGSVTPGGSDDRRGAYGGCADRMHSGSTLPKTFDPLTTTAVVAAAAATGVAAIGLGRRIRDRFSNDED